ncbi:MAG: hypothetical protein PHV13_01965 [Candidatus ainarchaeum sp.]|nr:hypothetical protein [Candidatus ainarchaeum sp.]
MAEEENAEFDVVFGYACAGTVILLCVIALIYVLLGFRKFSYRKKDMGSQTSLVVKANRDLFRIAVVARFNKEEITFERRRIRKGQSVEFVYPRSDQKAKLIVEAESGHARAYEV